MKTTTTFLAAALLACGTANASECEYRGGKQDCREFLRQMQQQLRRQQPPHRQHVDPDVRYMNGVPLEQFEQQQQLQQQGQQLQQQQQINDMANRLQNAGRYLQSINPAPAAPTACTFQRVDGHPDLQLRVEHAHHRHHNRPRVSHGWM
jgi:hypothetical protein